MNTPESIRAEALPAHITALRDLRVGVELDRHVDPMGDAKLAALDAAISALEQKFDVPAAPGSMTGPHASVGGPGQPIPMPASASAAPNPERQIWQSWNHRSGYGYWDSYAEAELNSDPDHEPVLFVSAALLSPPSGRLVQILPIDLTDVPDEVLTESGLAEKRRQVSEQAAVPTGHALVPVEPTPQMIKAWHDAYSTGNRRTGRSAFAYRAMIAAAPTPPAVAQAQNDEWRRLALQFDAHRMQAIGWLKRAEKALPETDNWNELRAFLAAPPLPGEKVLADRIAALAVASREGPKAEPVPDDQEREARFIERLERTFPAPAAPSQEGMGEPVKRDWKAIESAVEDYVDGYELRDDPACHTPNEMERLLISDAIHGLLADDEFMALLAAPVAQPACVDPTDPGHDVTGLREHVRHLERRVRQLSQPAASAEPLFWYRPVCGGEMYEGPVHHKSVGGKMLRDEKPDEWVPLYPGAAPVAAQAQQDAEDAARWRKLLALAGEYVDFKCTFLAASAWVVMRRDPAAKTIFTYSGDDLVTAIDAARAAGGEHG